MARTALITTTTASQIDCTNAQSENAISITATVPDGCDIRYAFKYAENWQRYNTSSAAWENLTTQGITAASLLSEGNTQAELTALDSSKLAAFAGKKVDVAIAMKMDETAAEAPSVSSITFDGESGATVTTETLFSDTVTLSTEPVEILSIDVDKTEDGGGTAAVLASANTSGDTWTDYTDYSNYVTNPATKAQAIRFKYVLSAPTIGSSTAKVNSVTIKHRTDSVAVFTEGTGVCISKTYNFVNNINRAHLILKHPVVQDTEFSAEISLRKPTTNVTGEVLGTGDGAAHTYTLKNKDGLASHGFALYFDGVQQAASKYSYSPNDGQVTCTADSGVAITADYIYGWTAEQFQAMTHDTQYPDKQDNNLVFDQFDYIATKDSDLRGPIGCVRVNIAQKTGSVKDAALGTGTGEMQSYKLEHHAKAETISVKPAGAKWKYRNATDVLQVTAAKGEAVSVSYDWAARPNYIEDLSCFFNE